MYRLFFRTIFIISTCIAIVTLWQYQLRTTQNQYLLYTQQLGERLSQMSAGALAPWLEDTLNAAQPDTQPLTDALNQYLLLGDFKGIRLFNSYGVTLASVGEYSDIIELAKRETAPYTVHVAPVQIDNKIIGYVRFIIADDVMNAQLNQQREAQKGLLIAAVFCSILLGGLSVRWYYLAARRLYRDTQPRENL